MRRPLPSWNRALPSDPVLRVILPAGSASSAPSRTTHPPVLLNDASMTTEISDPTSIPRAELADRDEPPFRGPTATGLPGARTPGTIDTGNTVVSCDRSGLVRASANVRFQIEYVP
jgi:hypothetical protein